MSHSATYLKEAAIDFLQLVSGGQVSEAYEKYAGEHFIHHNPYFKGDKQSLQTAMQQSADAFPNQVIQIKHALQENEMVAVHSRVVPEGDETGMAVVHLFRFEDMLIAELWDVIMPEPHEIINENGLY